MGNSPTLLKLYKVSYMPGSVVLITGASSGIGLQLTKIYAARGCPIVITGRNEKALQDLVSSCNSEFSNFNVHYVIGEVTLEADCQKIVDFCIRKFARIDICVLAAGVTAHGKFEESPNLEIFKKIMDVNLFGYVNMTKFVLPHLIKTRGQFVVISSMSGVVPLPYRTAYCASKHAINGFFRSLAYEVKDKVDITVCMPPTVNGSNFRNNSLSG